MTFPRLVATMGINPDAERSRQIARNSGLGFDGLQNEFPAATDAYDLETLRLR